MKANDILRALNAVKPTKQEKTHADQLAAIYKLMQTIAPAVESVEIKPQNFDFGSSVTFNYYREPERREGKVMPGELWTIKTKTGTYKNSIPTGNDFYRACRLLFPGLLQPVEAVAVAADHSVIFNERETEQIRTAAKFIVFDRFATSKNFVHVTVSAGRFQTMGTNGVKLYRSPELVTELADMVLLLPVQELKAAKGKELRVDLVNDSECKLISGFINGIPFESCADKPLNYAAVIPTYSKFVEVNRRELITAVKQILPTANKTTKQINLHINGSIFLSGCDLDFSHESGVNVPYQQKTAPDFDISFNGKYLLDALTAIDGGTVCIYSDGNPNKAALLNQDVLLMPFADC